MIHEDAIKLFQLMFEPNDTICVSDSKFGYHSVPMENVIAGKTTLLSPTEGVEIKTINSNDLIFVAINPIYGWRKDQNTTRYVNFLLECDVGTIEHQINYVKRMGMPYSAIVFSGSKSAHILICLDKPIPNEKIYRTIYEWILKIGALFDPNCKNPSRSTRIPGAIRPETGKTQQLIEFKGPVKTQDLMAWLNLHPDQKPIKRERKPIKDGDIDFSRVKPWVKKIIKEGPDRSRGRNKSWFTVGCEFALAGFDEDATIDMLLPYFQEEHDFKEKEFESALRSGFKYIYENRDRNG